MDQTHSQLRIFIGYVVYRNRGQTLSDGGMAYAELTSIAPAGLSVSFLTLFSKTLESTFIT